MNKHTVWWNTDEAQQAIAILNGLMDAANAGNIDQHITPALGIAIDAIQVLEFAIDQAEPADEDGAINTDIVVWDNR
jgi:hypothetical protein